MRINIYSQELITDDRENQTIIEPVVQKSNTSVTYSAVRMLLHSSERLHRPPEDTMNRSAITFWLPKSPTRREWLARTFEHMAQLVRAAPAETGLD